ncbi:MAG: uroporphyrinogen III synthase [Caulobacter sp. 12-67-6]|nr:MAG: uroporphyrinogen III synthase [Caulobacter sp. 12-67-6]OYX71538.1 MAG: uroporphyrinogen III synthase [Caulobacter sp. 32-67-35]OYX98932.1 MAG: uroporphyrinogen III synthase [Caulobacter sp. 35-67-4]OZA79430.1 MAG: uroporphyrinogen III synthase [Caulobacter sp. 39-67-4]HQR89114.1 uroporphyrinogen-III synthase [Caulobacter sp.]
MTASGAIWITRARPGAESTARRVEALGFQARVDPLLEIVFLDPVVDLSGIAALAFTSANGVEAFARLTAGRDLPVFAVGETTTRAARAAGFAKPASADGDVEALAALIARARPGPLLCAGASEPAVDLPARLQAEGLTARALPVYAALDRSPTSETLAALAGFDAALLHSPRAARGLAAVLESAPAPALRVLCLSQAVAEPLAAALGKGRVGSVAFASRPRESALLDLLPR